MTKPVVLVSFQISPEVETEFNRFYHRDFLTTLAKHSPEIERIIRYEALAVGGTLNWYAKQFHTFYELVDDSAMNRLSDIFSRPEVSAVIKAFGEWKEKHLLNFSRFTFAPRWEHRRGDHSQPFTGPAFFWQHEIKLSLEEEFRTWYEQEYLPLQLAEVPTWSSARRYISVDKEKNRYLTWFEAFDEASLGTCLKDLRAPHRLADNMDWQRRVQAAVEWQDVGSFRPIFRWPD